MDEGKGKKSQIFCLTWVKRGAAKLEPDRVILSPDELKSVMNNENHGEDEDDWEDVDDSDEEIETPRKHDSKDDIEKELEHDDDDLAEYNMDDYDDEVGDFSSGVTGLVMFADNNEDPYITKKIKTEQISDTESEAEQEEKSSVRLRTDDNLLVCARCGQHSSVLEVYVYNHNSKDFYVHHDIPLLETPLCMQWLGFDPGADDVNSGNLLAVGNFNGSIDIWDLDILNTLEPVFSIGRTKSLKKRRKCDFQHNDAVLDLAWTDAVKDQVASASADATVALWDLELGKSICVFKNHKNKVQTIEWRKNSAEQLLSGAFDGNILLLDSDDIKSAVKWKVDGEVERVSWNQMDSNYFVASTDKGMVYYTDVRKPGEYIHNWLAHEVAIPGLVMGEVTDCKNGNLLFTASSDGFVKTWDINKEKPKLVYERDIKMGMVHCCQQNPDVKPVIAFGGQKDNIRLWDVCKTSEIAGYLGINYYKSGVNDILNPLGGSLDDGEDMKEYIEGGDYLKSDKASNTEINNGRNGFGNKKQKKKKKFANLTQNSQFSEMVIKTEMQEKKIKKPRKKKNRTKINMLQKEDLS